MSGYVQLSHFFALTLASCVGVLVYVTYILILLKERYCTCNTIINTALIKGSSSMIIDTQTDNQNYFCFLSTTSTQSTRCLRFFAFALLLPESISMTSTSLTSGEVGGVRSFLGLGDPALFFCLKNACSPDWMLPVLAFLLFPLLVFSEDSPFLFVFSTSFIILIMCDERNRG